jgi:hypothetical protein
MQIVENIGMHKQLQSHDVQVTLQNPEEISAVFPQLSSNIVDICKDYDWSVSQYVELKNQMIVKKCERR